MAAKNRIIQLVGFLYLCASVLSSCGNTSNKCTTSPINSDDTQTGVTDSIKVSVFGVETKADEYSVAKRLEKAGIIKIDNLSMENGKFQSAVIEFAGIKFGMNQGFIFITSSQDKETVNILVSKISEFYGKPEIDGNVDDPEYCYYNWNLKKSDSEPSIKIRPLHAEDGGLVMIWSLN